MTSAQMQTVYRTGTRVLRINAPNADDVFLGIVECRPASPGRLRPVLLVHGATLGVRLFDLPLPGYSLFSALSEGGRTVYGVDIRGYGYSLSGRVMNSPPEAHPPFARLEDAVEDIATAVEFICEREGVPAVDLIGFSWGTVASASYATVHAERVAHLALYAPLYGERNNLWLDRIGDPQDKTRINPAIGAYRLVSCEDIRQRWNGDLGHLDPESARERGVAELIFSSVAALDPQTQSHSPPAFRSPAGALADLIRIFNGEPLYDPARLTMPILLVRGEDDTTATDSDARRLLSKITSRRKEYRVITPGSHFLCVEKNRAELYKQLRDFFESDD